MAVSGAAPLTESIIAIVFYFDINVQGCSVKRYDMSTEIMMCCSKFCEKGVAFKIHVFF